MALPLYSLPGCAPSYSSLPQNDEETIEYNPRHGRSATSGTFVRRWQQVDLILKGQEEEARLPCYGRGGVIDGELGISSPEKVLEVTVLLEGRLSVATADSGSTGATVVFNKITLWKGDGSGKRCPTILPFIMQFPLTFKSEERDCRLPPSFEATFLELPALFARCSYTLCFSVTRMRQYKLGSWTSSKSYTTLLTYRPRTRPYRPLVQVDSTFSSLKREPEEWLQLMSTMAVNQNSKMKPIECHFLVPSIQTYAISDSIPFHVQLSSSLQSLQELLPPSCDLLKPPQPDVRQQGRTGYHSGNFAVRVYIARQVVVEIHGRRRLRTTELGVAKLRAVPPLAINQDIDVGENVCVDWEGDVRCWGEVLTGGFSSGPLIVKDFLVLSLMPSDSRNSFLMPMQLAHPIKLVTDPWGDDATHPQDH